MGKEGGQPVKVVAYTEANRMQDPTGARHAGSQANEAGQIPQGSTGYGMERWTARVRQEMRND